MAKLTTRQVKRLKRELAEDKLTQPELAIKYSISRSLVSNIATGRAYKSVKGPTAPPKAPKGQSKKVPEYDPAEPRVLELEAEVVHLRDERNQAQSRCEDARLIQSCC